MDELKEYLSTLDNDINPDDWDYIEDYDLADYYTED